MRRRVSAGQIIERFRLFLEQEGRSPITIRNYRSDLEGFIRWSESQSKKDFNVSDFAVSDLHQYRKSLVHRFKASTTNRKLASLKIFLRWASDAGLSQGGEVPRVPNVKLTPN